MIFPVSLPTIWCISSHCGSGKENRQTEPATASQMHLTLDLLLSLSTNSVINILKNTPFCLQISIIDMQMATNTQRQNPWSNFPQTTHSAPASRKCARNTLCPSHDFFMTLHHGLNIESFRQTLIIMAIQYMQSSSFMLFS